MIGTLWQNIHTQNIAKILSEPSPGLFELMYENREGLPEYYQTSHNWQLRDLHKHWRELDV